METRKATGFDDWLGRGNLKEKKEWGMTSRFLLQVSGQMVLPFIEVNRTKQVNAVQGSGI